MPLTDSFILILVCVLMLILLILMKKNTKLLHENQKLEERLKLQNKYISDNKISSQKEILEEENSEKDIDISLSEKVLRSIEAGETKLSISKTLDIPLSKIAFILKVEALKKHH